MDEFLSLLEFTSLGLVKVEQQPILIFKIARKKLAECDF